jgi:Ca2+-transporting ATPase
MLPAHVVLTEMVIDPLCSFAFEGVAATRGLMHRPPRGRDEHLFRKRSLASSMAAGALLLLAALAVWLAALLAGVPTDEARALAIAALTAGNLALVWTLARPEGARGLAPSVALSSVTVFSLVALAAGVLLPSARELLRFGLPPAHVLLAAAAAGLAAGIAAGLVAAQASRRAAPRRAGRPMEPGRPASARVPPLP